MGGAGGVAGLEDVEAACFYGELDVLDIAVVGFEAVGEALELGVDVGEGLGQAGDVLGGADACDNVFALGVDEVLAEEALVAGGGVAGEEDAGAGVVAEVAEDHGHDVDGGAHVVGDAAGVAVGDGAGTVPTAEDGVDGAFELLPRVLGDFGADLTLDGLLEVGGDGTELVDGQFLVLGDAGLGLVVVEDFVEDPSVDAEDDASVHVDEAAVGIEGDALVVHEASEAVDGLLVDAEIEDGVHHAGHGDGCAGADGDEEGGVGGAEMAACGGLDVGHVGLHVVPEAVGEAPACVVVGAAGLGGDDEAGRDGQAEASHLAEVRAFASQQVAHTGVALVESVHHLGSLGHAGPPFLPSLGCVGRAGAVPVR